MKNIEVGSRVKHVKPKIIEQYTLEVSEINTDGTINCFTGDGEQTFGFRRLNSIRRSGGYWKI